MKKKLLVIFLCGFTLLLALSGCFTIHDKFCAEQFYCEVIDENSIAIGDVSNSFSADYVFVPHEINGYTVKKLGFTSGLGFGGNGYLTSYSPDNYELKRYYCPNTVEVIGERYMYMAQNLKVFYCGKVVNLGELNASAQMDSIEYYVPNEMYSEFYEAIYESCKNVLYKANVVYLLNYETNNEYYYVDYYEYSSLIEYVPPIPTREGYEFNGWYKEVECINKWIFEEDKMPETEFDNDGELVFVETQLYAKWIVA